MKKLSEMTPAERAARVKKLVANPGTRAAVPIQYLPAQYRNARIANDRRARENATVYNPLALLSGQDLRRTVNAEVESQFRPSLNEIDRQIGALGRQSQTAQDRIRQYFGQAQPAMNAAVTQGRTAKLELDGQLAGISQQNKGAIDAAAKEAQDFGVKDTALRGQGLDAGLAERVAAAKAQAQGMASTLNEGGAKAYLADAGAQTNTAATAAAVAPMRMNDQLAVLASKYHNDVTDLQGKRGDIISQLGNARVSTLDKLRQQQFENYITGKTLNIKETEAKAAGQLNPLDKAKLDYFNKHGYWPSTGAPKGPSTSDQINREKLAFFRKHGYWPPTGPPKGSKGGKELTPKQKADLIKGNDQWRSLVDSAVSFYGPRWHQVIKDDKGKKIGYMDSATLRRALNTNSKYSGDKLLHDIVLYRVQGLPIPTALIKQLKKRNIGVPKSWTSVNVGSLPNPF